MVEVMTLVSPEDIAEARMVGRKRYASAVSRNRTQPFGDPGEKQRVFIDCYSALAEVAVARFLDLPWRNEFFDDLWPKPPDVGDTVEVRWTKHLGGSLIGHDTDTDGWIVVSVQGELPVMKIVGWTTAIALKNSMYQNNPRARSTKDYWMPPKDMFAIDLLLQMQSRWSQERISA